ncbi:hypothetical protein, partial [Pantoea ananatis]|uniref:hypothetical protein n=2 Tax=Erwiniaceae TaxID=1903409 RepID=UPI001B313408
NNPEATALADNRPMSDETATEDIYTLIGRIVTHLLRPDGEIHLQDILSSLHHFSQQSSDKGEKRACEEAIRLLSRQLH